MGTNHDDDGGLVRQMMLHHPHGACSTIADAKQLLFGHTVEIERAKKMHFGLHVASAYLASFFLVLFVAMFLRLLWPIVPLIAGVIEFLAIAFEVHMALPIPAILLRRYSWRWVVHPFLGILTVRDELLAGGLPAMTVSLQIEHYHNENEPLRGLQGYAPV